MTFPDYLDPETLRWVADVCYYDNREKWIRRCVAAGVGIDEKSLAVRCGMRDLGDELRSIAIDVEQQRKSNLKANDAE